MKILLSNLQPMLGDRLMFTPVVRDLKKAHPDWEIGVESIGPEIWNNNPHIVGNMTGPDKVCHIGPGKVTRGSKTNGLHITAAFRCSLEEHLGEPVQQGPFKPEIFLSDEEKSLRLIDGKYWVINIDCGPFSAKRWHNERFQQLVEQLPNITFVQVGLKKDNQYRLRGPNVIDLIDQTKIRELFSLVYNAEGCISLISSLMHVAAAFDKPCVVLAGGREPATFEHYANHRYIDMIGCLPCCSKKACWHNAISACNTRVKDIARCMDMIRVDQVVDAVKSYYEGGILTKPEGRIEPARKRPIIRIVTNAKCLGGAERSALHIAKQFSDNNWRVELSPAGAMSDNFREAVPEGVIISNHITRGCDCFLLYASDMVYSFDKPQFEVFSRIKAKRRVMAITYKRGKTGQVPWTRGWDKYIFLSSTLRDMVLERMPNAGTVILAPPIDMKPFLAVQPDYNGGLRMVRHSSQGSQKFSLDLKEICQKVTSQNALRQAHPIKNNNGVKFLFMPGPPWPADADNIIKCPYDKNPAKVAEFLARGNCFWYLLPEFYSEQGPRVIVEAMAAGLAVIAENRDGPKDRVTPETGWLIDSHDEVIDLSNSLNSEQLQAKGQAARKRALEEFKAELWFENIIGD